MNSLFGILNVNKPAGLTSRDIVNHVKKIIRTEKVGHTGTLDPLATGVLLLAVGRATRLVDFAHDMTKRYDAEFELGLESDTLDIEGTIRQIIPAHIPSKCQLEQAISGWVGEIEQIPPNYSAIHLNGQRAYDLARRGIQFTLPSRRVNVHSIKLMRFDYPKFCVSIKCSSGTYVRSLGRDIAADLGTCAVMTKLNRTHIGDFDLNSSIEIESLQTRKHVETSLVPPQTLLQNYEALNLSDAEIQKLVHGIAIDLPQWVPKRIVCLDKAGRLVAIAEQHETGSYRSLRVFPTDQVTPQPSNTNAKHNPAS